MAPGVGCVREAVTLGGARTAAPPGRGRTTSGRGAGGRKSTACNSRQIGASTQGDANPSAGSSELASRGDVTRNSPAQVNSEINSHAEIPPSLALFLALLALLLSSAVLVTKAAAPAASHHAPSLRAAGRLGGGARAAACGGGRRRDGWRARRAGGGGGGQVRDVRESRRAGVDVES